MDPLLVLCLLSTILILNESAIEKREIGIYIGDWPYGREIQPKFIKAIENMDPSSMFKVKLITKEQMRSKTFASTSKFHIKIIFVHCEREYNSVVLNVINSDVHASVSYVISGSICTRYIGSNTKYLILPAAHFQHSLIQLGMDWLLKFSTEMEAISFVTDATTDMTAFQSILQLKDNFRSTNRRRIMFLIFHFPNTSFEKRRQFAQEIFQNISKVELRQHNFITYTSFQNTKLLLMEAHRNDYLKFPTWWFLHVTEKESTITEEIREILRNNVTFITITFPLNDANNTKYVRHIQSIYHCLTDHFTSVIEMASKVVYRSQYQFTISEEIQNVTKSLGKFNCDFKYQWELQTFAVGRNKNPVYTNNRYHLGFGFIRKDGHQPIAYQPVEFPSLLVRIFTRHDPPWQIVPDPCTNSLEDYHGVSMAILKEMQRKLRFQYTISCLNSSEKRLLNNSYTLWNLSLDKLLSEEVDLLAYPIIITDQRHEQVHFTPPFDLEAYTILSRKPKELSSMYIFFEPFKYEVWLLIALITVVVTAMLYFIQVTTAKKYISNQESKPYPEKWKDCLLYFYGTLSQQGMTLSSPSTSGRTLVSTWLLSVIIFTAIYSGNLVAFLSIPRFTPQIKNLEDLIKANSSVSWGLPKNSSLFLTFSENSPLKKLHYILDQAIIHPEINDEVLEKVIDGRHVIIDSKTSLALLLQHMNNTSRKQHFVFGDDIFFDKVSFAMRHSYPPYFKFDEIIDLVMMAGLVRKWKSEIFPRTYYTLDKTQATDGEELSISLTKFQSALYILGVGYITSIACLLLECTCKKSTRRRFYKWLSRGDSK